MRNIRFTVFLISILLLIFSGCTGEDFLPGDNILPDTQSKEILKLYLTDAPGEYDEVNILISRIDAHIAEVEQEEMHEGLLNYQDKDNAKKEEETGGEWMTLVDFVPDGLSVDLISLEGQYLLLSTTELSAGVYTQLRVFLMETASIVVEGETEDLLIPGSAQTGIKLTHPFEIVDGETTELTLDFDAYESIFKNGNGDYIMNPTIKVISGSY